MFFHHFSLAKLKYFFPRMFVIHWRLFTSVKTINIILLQFSYYKFDLMSLFKFPRPTSFVSDKSDLL